MNANKAPFPWHGKKDKWAAEVWKRLGDPEVYVEPFAGSLAVLLHRETPCPVETVCDTNGMPCNFWRSVKYSPKETAEHARYPIIHQDLTARNKHLYQ